jgi:hypothetical protein
VLDDLSPKCSLLGVRHLNGRQLDLADVGVLLGGVFCFCGGGGGGGCRAATHGGYGDLECVDTVGEVADDERGRVKRRRGQAPTGRVEGRGREEDVT